MKYSTTLITILLLCLISSFSYAEDESGSYEAVQQNISDLQREEVTTDNTFSNFESKVEFEKDKDVVKVISGTIGVSPYASMVKAGLSNNIANEIIRQFSYFINFRTDIHTDDVFNVKYSENKSNEKDTSTTTNFLFASIQTAKKTYKIYRFNDKYYNEKGEAIKCITNIEDRESNTSNDLVGKDLRNFKENMLKINSLKNGDKWETPHFTKMYSENDTLANDGKIIYPGQSAVKESKKNNIEALDELRRKFPSNLLQAIEEIELTIDDNDKRNHRRIAMIYIKDGYEQSCRIIGYHAVQEMLNILMDEGYKPFDERIWVSAHIYQKVKGVTGQNMVIPFGKAIYNYTNDSIEWES